MPRDKDLKRIIRARMQKTGESYTSARSHILDKPDRTAAGTASPASTVEYAAIAGMRDDAVEAATGRTWAGWVEALDRHGAQSLPHGEIARHVAVTYGVSGWWSQTVTVGYERIKGLREIGQRRDGHYEANRSRTVPVPVETLFQAWADPARRRRWLADAEPRRRTAIPLRSLRLTWPDGTIVIAYFEAKGESKSTVSVQHTKIPDRDTADALKTYWSTQLDRLTAYVKR